MKIVLLGYMASGKSAVGVVLANKMNVKFIDLDSYIEGHEQLTISEIFTKKGEIYFRKMEGDYLNEILDLTIDCVISLGGGTPCYGNNMDNIENKSISFYLNASINTIFKRLKNETTQRPLVASIGEGNLKEYIAKHLFERSFYYKRASHTILINKKSIFEIIDDILGLI